MRKCKICKRKKEEGTDYFSVGWICDDCMDKIYNEVSKKIKGGANWKERRRK